jgi:DNA modification methylase
MSKVKQGVFCGDCRDLMRGLPAGCVDLVFADPPYNIGYAYDLYEDSTTKEEYVARTEEWVGEAVRVLRPSGSVYVVIGDELAAEVKMILDRRFHWRNWIIWKYTFGQNCTKKFNRCHAHILYYVKDEKRFTFNEDVIRVPSARQEVYGDKRANPRGKLPDDVWDFSRVCGTFKERTKAHPCQMPERVVERAVLASTLPGDLVLDPFCGSGTTAAVAKRLGRRYWTCDVSEKYVRAAGERLEKVREGLGIL